MGRQVADQRAGALGDTEALGETEALGDTDALGLTDGDSDALGETEALGLREALELVLGDTLALGLGLDTARTLTSASITANSSSKNSMLTFGRELFHLRTISLILSASKYTIVIPY